jgi:hypothetical protein
MFGFLATTANGGRVEFLVAGVGGASVGLLASILFREEVSIVLLRPVSGRGRIQLLLAVPFISSLVLSLPPWIEGSVCAFVAVLATSTMVRVKRNRDG